VILFSIFLYVSAFFFVLKIRQVEVITFDLLETF